METDLNLRGGCNRPDLKRQCIRRERQLQNFIKDRPDLKATAYSPRATSSILHLRHQTVS
ncbi:hypothetical protein DPMN_159887 [Dreissena polymorpha]|uniref:Uncharacterized protein n=1 Tax=Dreissena polymorpha TaxID=45954 RepID=A0A9D4EP43_DREPO|nr:hypothetical protein DPMN_159887 [Dreissena polymorpha]